MKEEKGSRADRLFRSVLRLFPFDFRADYGQEMEEVFREQRVGLEKEKSTMGLLKLWGQTLAGIFTTAPREHWEMFRQDASYALRRMRQTPGFTALVVLTLALGIGANTAIFSVVDAVLLRPLPYRDGDRLLVVRQPRQHPPLVNLGFSDKELTDYRGQTRSFENLVEYHSMVFTLLGGDEAYRVQSGVVSWDFFDVFGVRPLHGRNFLPSDERADAEAVLMLSHDFWRTKFREDPNIIGRVMQMNNRPHTIVGVLPPFPQYPNENDVYMPSTACPFRNAADFKANRAARMMSVFARLKTPASREAALADLDTVKRRLHGEYRDAYPQAAGMGITAAQLRDELTRPARPTFLILLGTVGFVLLIACANVANLLLSRTINRERELAIRTALGANRIRLVRQLLTESAILALAGGVLGLVLASLSQDMLKTFTARFTTRAAEVSMDASVLLFTLGVALFTGLLFGTLPALLAGHDVSNALKEGGSRASLGRQRHLARSGLVVLQAAFSLVLLVGAGLMLRSLLKLERVNAGYRAENVLSARVTLNFTKYDTVEKANAFRDRLLERLRASPGVVSAAVGTLTPLSGQRPFTRNFGIEGRTAEQGQPSPTLVLNAVTPDYFRTLGIPLVQGRLFTDLDGAQPNALQVAVINLTMARHYWPGEDPVGRRITLDNGRTWVTIVGVVGDVRHFGLDQAPTEDLYRPAAQFGFGGGRLLVRSVADPLSLARVVRETVRSIDPDNPVDQIRTLEELRSESTASPRLTAILLGIFAALALGITAAGIAGVMALSVSQRTHEIGIRMALGASPGSVLGMVMGHGLGLVLLGLGVGVAGALPTTRLMAGLLYAVEPTDPPTYVAVALVLLASAALACFVPARRAATIDPMAALRTE